MKIKTNFPLKKLTTFHLGGPAKYFTRISSLKSLKKALQFAKVQNLPVFIIGNGSNLLVTDSGFNGLVIKFASQKISKLKKTSRYTYLQADTGVSWDNFVKDAVSQNLQGIECLSGIPGTIGGGIVQNIGAYGQEISTTFVSASVYDLSTNRIKKLTRRQCCFAYRASLFKKSKHLVILNAVFKLKNNSSPCLKYASLKNHFTGKFPTLPQVRRAVLSIRRQKLDDPKIIGNAGSFFQNPIISQTNLKSILKKYPALPSFPEAKGYKLFAGWLIDQCNFKGKKYKNAAVSTKNALVLTNPQFKATAKEVLQLAQKIQTKVKQKFGITLIPEVEVLK